MAYGAMPAVSLAGRWEPTLLSGARLGFGTTAPATDEGAEIEAVGDSFVAVARDSIHTQTQRPVRARHVLDRRFSPQAPALRLSTNHTWPSQAWIPSILERSAGMLLDVDELELPIPPRPQFPVPRKRGGSFDLPSGYAIEPIKLAPVDRDNAMDVASENSIQIAPLPLSQSETVPTMAEVRAVMVKTAVVDAESGEARLVGKEFADFATPTEVATIEAITSQPTALVQALNVLLEFVDASVTFNPQIAALARSQTNLPIWGQAFAAIEDIRVAIAAILPAILLDDREFFAGDDGRTVEEKFEAVLRSLGIEDILQDPLSLPPYQGEGWGRGDFQNNLGKDFVPLLAANLIDGPARDRLLALVDERMREAIQSLGLGFVDVRGRQILADREPTTEASSEDLSPARVGTKGPSPDASDHGADTTGR